MKNLNALLKKVELFERLAVYGDRRSFLEALAQQTDWTDEMHREGDLPEDHSIPAPPAPLSYQPTLNLPEQTIMGNPPSRSPSIDQQSILNVQKYLNQKLPYSEIKEDGIWGPETAKLVLEWAQKNNLHLGLQQLVDLIKAKAMGADAVNSLTGPKT